ncbi:MAG: hypothetical protein ACYDC5_02080 [Candidatus Dormibacteria bacterium]
MFEAASAVRTALVGWPTFYSVMLLEGAIVLAVLLAGGGYRWLRRRAVGGRGQATGQLTERGQEIRGRWFLRRCLGAIWILDGLLQAQPGMPAGLPGGILSPAAAGQPSWLVALLHWETSVWQAHPVHLAVATVLIQVGIGATILGGGNSRLGRLALWGSIGWGVLVWAFGEAFGGLLAPGASLLSGSPGSVLAYMAAAALLLAPAEWWHRGAARRALEVGVGGVFLVGAGLQTLPFEGFWTPGGIGGTFSAVAKLPQPSLLSGPVRALGAIVATDPLLWNTILVAAMAGIGVTLCLGGMGRWVLAAALSWTAFAWWFGQDFGGFGTGVATDPNLAPLLALFLLTACLAPDRKLPGEEVARVAWSHPGLLRGLAIAGGVTLAVGMFGALPYLSQAVAHSGSAPAAAALAESHHRAP